MVLFLGFLNFILVEFQQVFFGYYAHVLRLFVYVSLNVRKCTHYTGEISSERKVYFLS